MAEHPVEGVAGPPVVSAVGLTRRFAAGGEVVTAVAEVDVALHAGSLVVLQGRSGSGKTTLLNLFAGLERPDGGSVRVAGIDLAGLGDVERAAVRREHVGYIFQAFGLLPVLTAAENVALPLRLRRDEVASRRQRVHALLASMGLVDRADHRPDELSGGEQQRVAVARALAADPVLLLADEPTAQLDTANGRVVMELLRKVADSGTAVLVATHDPIVVTYADRILTIEDGRLEPGTAAGA